MMVSGWKRSKKHCGNKYLSYNDAVEEALCFGWIDSFPRKLDQDRTMLWLSPRRMAGGWSKLNKERIQKMTAAGLMTPAGFQKISAAKADGSWFSLDASANLEIPADLQTALSSYSSAQQHFEAFLSWSGLRVPSVRQLAPSASKKWLGWPKTIFEPINQHVQLKS